MATVYYPTGCAEAIPDHYCNPCEAMEHARVRSVAFIKDSFSFVDPTDPTEWQTGIENRDIIVISEVLGQFDGGQAVEGPGYGDQQSKLTGFNFELAYKDPNYKNNADFYNAIKNSRNFKVAFRTETQTHISENNVSVIPRNPVSENLTDEVVWDVLVKFSQADLPEPTDTPANIFQCFDYEAA